MTSKDAENRKARACHSMRQSKVGWIKSLPPITKKAVVGSNAALVRFKKGEVRNHVDCGLVWNFARPHRRIRRGGAPPPLADRLRVQAVPGGQGPGARLRPLELGSNTRRRAGAAMKNPCHRASSS